MKIKTKRILFLLLLIAGIVWNILCAVSIVPLRFCGLSVFITAPCLLPWLFLLGSSERSKYLKELSVSEKRLAIETLLLIAVWFFTMLLCILRG